MTITRLHAGPRMSQAVIHGSTVYLAGQVADQAKGKSVTDQTREILAAIERLLAEAGSDKTKILSTTIYLADIATFAEMNAVWDAWVAAGHAPAREPSRPSWPRRLILSRSHASPGRAKPLDAAAGSGSPVRFRFRGGRFGACPVERQCQRSV